MTGRRPGPSGGLPADVSIASVRLRVADLDRQVRFYRDVLGFGLLGEDGPVVGLGPEGERPLLVLEHAPAAPARPPGTTGLFHVAWLLPSRADLGAMILRVGGAGVPFQGFADHHVSEAAYLADPEGNGIELYADRPREAWRWTEQGLHLTTDPLDVASLTAEAPGSAEPLPAGTRVGHVHLRVSTLAAAEAFYVDRLGFDVVTRTYPGALFVSAGGYHHHLGFNVWGGAGAPRPPEGGLGLAEWTLSVPDADVRRALTGWSAGGRLTDADGVVVRVVGEGDARPSA